MWVPGNTGGFQVEDGHFHSPRMREGHMRPGPRVGKTCTRAQHGFHGWGTVRIGHSRERCHSLRAPAPTEETLILGITDWGQVPCLLRFQGEGHEDPENHKVKGLRARTL